MVSLVYFIRHGQTGWNAEYRLQGQADTDMTPLGKSQADANGRKLAGLVPDPQDFDYVASPLRRTRETMERIRTAMGLDPMGYRTDARLMEVNFGDWQGHTFAELEAKSPGTTAQRFVEKWDFLPPGAAAESYATLLTRFKLFFDGMADRSIVVTHGGVVRVLFRLLAGMEKNEAAMLDIPQDRILRYRDARLEWI